jgi:riboflavin transporter FmnP
MTEKELSELNDQELLAKRKKIKSSTTMNNLIIGVLLGTMCYSTVKNGFGFFTFFPLVLIFIIIKNSKVNKELGTKVEEIVKSRNLQ